jgi:hypothetical protein
MTIAELESPFDGGSDFIGGNMVGAERSEPDGGHERAGS